MRVNRILFVEGEAMEKGDLMGPQILRERKA
jgi:hypothetical protein